MDNTSKPYANETTPLNAEKRASKGMVVDGYFSAQNYFNTSEMALKNS